MESFRIKIPFNITQEARVYGEGLTMYVVKLRQLLCGERDCNINHIEATVGVAISVLPSNEITVSNVTKQ